MPPVDSLPETSPKALQPSQLPNLLRESNLLRLRIVSQLTTAALIVAKGIEWFELRGTTLPFRWEVEVATTIAVGASWLNAVLMGRTQISASRRLQIARLWYVTLCLCLAFMECVYWPEKLGRLPGGLSRVCLAAAGAPTLFPDAIGTAVLFSSSLLLTLPLGHLLAGWLGHRIYEPFELAIIMAHQLDAVFVAWLAAASMEQLRLALKQEYGSYRLLRKLAEGGYGQVWEAFHKRLKRPAAVKIIRGEGGEAGMSERFEREAEMLSLLECPHTVKLYDYGRSDDGQLYLAMELLRGMDLERLVEQHGPMPPERVTSLLAQACLSLEEAHLCGLIHRDIKPGNLYLCQVGMESDFVKVIDFGLAKPQMEKSSLTTDEQILGTVDYMSPEQLMSQPLDGRSDLYSLGATGYFLLTGTNVFLDPSIGKTVEAHLNRRPEPPSQRLGREVPAALEKLILQCLEKHPDQRPQSARALYERLSVLPTWSRAEAALWWANHGASSMSV